MSHLCLHADGKVCCGYLMNMTNLRTLGQKYSEYFWFKKHNLVKSVQKMFKENMTRDNVWLMVVFTTCRMRSMCHKQ